MKQDIIDLIPTANKNIISIDNWPPITLLTVDYNVRALVYMPIDVKPIVMLLFLKLSLFFKGPSYIQ